MSKLNLRSVFMLFVFVFFLLCLGGSTNATTLRWLNDVEDWSSGVILGVDDLYVGPLDKSYDVTFVDGDNPLSIYGLDASSEYGELYENALWTTGHQMSTLRSYFDGLSATNIDPRLINGIENRSSFDVGVINLLYWYNGAGIGQMMTTYIKIYLNSSDMVLGGGWHNPDTYVTYWETLGDRVYATFVESGIDTTPTVPEPATMLLLGVGLIGIAGATRRKLKK